VDLEKNQGYSLLFSPIVSQVAGLSIRPVMMSANVSSLEPSFASWFLRSFGNWMQVISSRFLVFFELFLAPIGTLGDKVSISKRAKSTCE